MQQPAAPFESQSGNSVQFPQMMKMKTLKMEAIIVLHIAHHTNCISLDRSFSEVYIYFYLLEING